jgi:hypothetical protein
MEPLDAVRPSPRDVGRDDEVLHVQKRMIGDWNQRRRPAAASTSGVIVP